MIIIQLLGYNIDHIVTITPCRDILVTLTTLHGVLHMLLLSGAYLLDWRLHYSGTYVNYIGYGKDRVRVSAKQLTIGLIAFISIVEGFS